MKSEEPTIRQILQRVPTYLREYFLGFCIGAISDITTTSQVLGSVALAFATKLWIGIAAFFLTHVAIQMINALSGGIVHAAQVNARAIIPIGRAFENAAHPLVTVPPAESDEG